MQYIKNQPKENEKHHIHTNRNPSSLRNRIYHHKSKKEREAFKDDHEDGKKPRN